MMGVLNGALFGFVDNVISPYLVLSVFVNRLGGSNLLVGLLPALYFGGWFLPQFLVSHRLARLSRKLIAYNLAAVIRLTSWSVLILATFLVGASDPGLLLTLFFLCFAAFCFAGGLGGASFMNIVAKTIPVERRGTFFGRRDFTGALLAIGGGYIVNLLLSPETPLSFPNNFGILFVISGVAAAVGLGAFALVVEPVDIPGPQPLTFRRQLSSARRILYGDHIYRRYLLTRIALVAADIATPFYAIFATTVLHVPLDTVGIYIACTTGSILITNPILSRFSDRRGHRIVLLIAASGMPLMPLIALAFGVLPAGPQLGLPFALVFVVAGISRSAGNIAFPSYLLEIAPAEERPLYIGLTNTIVGVVTFLPLLGGLLLDLAGFDTILWLTVGISLLAWSLARGMVEPRQLTAPA